MSTTISKVAYKAVWDSSNLAKGLMNTRSMFLEQKKILQSMQQPVDRYTTAQQNLANMLAKFPDLQKHKLHLESQIEKQYLREEAAIRKLTAAEKARFAHLQKTTGEKPEEKSRSTLALLSRDPRVAVAAMAAGVGLSARAAIGDGMEAYKEVERVEAAFNTFAGSLEESRRLMQEIRSLSADTGVSFSALSEGAKTLMMRDVGASQSIDLMKKMAVVTGGNADKMRSLALAMAHTSQAGRLMGQDLTGMINAGWTPLEEISKKTLIPIGELRHEMEKGHISYKMVADALDAAVSAGGRYHGFLESLEGTTARAADKTAAAWEEASARIGAAWKPITMEYQSGRMQFNDNYSNFLEGIGSWLSTYFDRETAIKNQMAAWESSGGNAMVGMIGRDSKSLDAKLAPGMKAIHDYDARMKAQKDHQQKMIEDEKKRLAAQEAALKPTEQGQLLLQQANHELERERLLTMKAAEGESERVKLLEKRLDLTERIADREKRTAALKEQGASELEIKRIIALEEKRSDIEKERQKAAERKKIHDKLLSESQRVADRRRSPEGRRIDELTEMELARRRGVMSQTDYNRATGELFRDDTMRSGSLAQNMTVGSQEAYAFLAGVQDRNQREAAARHREQQKLQNALIDATKQVKAAIEALEPIGVAG